MIKFTKKKGPVVSKKETYDGITFASGLEKYMYQCLKNAGIKAEYEKTSYVLLPDFFFVNDCVEKQDNGKGDFKERGNKKIRKLVYTPDFEGDTFIIETKGRANDAFPLRWKMFKHYLVQNKDLRTLYKPQTKADCDAVIRMIKIQKL